MASIILGCGALVSSRLKKRQEAKQEMEREYAENFEKLKMENEKRVKRLSNIPPQWNPADLPDHSQKPPPTYDDVRRDSVESSGRMESLREHRIAEAGAPNDSRNQGARIQTVQTLRPKGSMVDRRDWAAVTTTTA